VTDPDLARDLVLCDVRDGVATLTLNDPDRRNAWSVDMEHRYFALLDEVGADDAVRAIVLTGAGRSFCPGLDTSRLAATAAGDGLRLTGRRPVHHALTIPKPMIAAINGACAGIGLVQALVCDVRFVARGARLSTAYARRGLPAEYGTSWLLPRLVGTERALDLLLSARTFSGEEAVELGVASRLCDADAVLDAAVAYARDLARCCSPRSMAVIRRQVWGDLSRGYGDANAVWLDAMRQGNADNPDFVEGVASFVERRDPEFRPLPDDVPLPELPPFHPHDRPPVSLP
jgi:enoyl-CoA hydratase/carnithine racemase